MSIPIDIQLEDLICPISHQIFNDPVVAEDGITYEADEIKLWMKQSTLSPVTNKPIKNLVPNYIIKSVVDKYLEKNPEQIKNKYKISRDHVDYIETVDTIIKSGNHAELLNYKKFHIDFFYNYELLKKLFEKNNTTVIKHVIDNAINLEVESGNKNRPIHYASVYASFRIIRYLIRKKINLNVVDKDGTTLLHLGFMHNRDLKIIKYLVEKAGGLEIDDHVKWKPIHHACQNSQAETIKFLLGKNVRTDGVTDDNDTPASLILENKNLTKAEKMELLDILVKE